MIAVLQRSWENLLLLLRNVIQHDGKAWRYEALGPRSLLWIWNASFYEKLGGGEV